MKNTATLIRPAASLLLLFTLITGLLYPGIVTAVAAIAFPSTRQGDIALIGQQFTDPKYFWGRPSATNYGPVSGGSNLSPGNPEQLKLVEERALALKKADPKNGALVPLDLVTASASGLDPHISTAAAEYQVPRVARLRKMEESKVRSLVKEATQGKQLGILGQPRVNVLALNKLLEGTEVKGER